MRHFIALAFVFMLALPGINAKGQSGHPMVPLPDFADYRQGISEAHYNQEAGRKIEGSTYEDGEMIRFESTGLSVSVFTTSYPIEEVRQMYIEKMVGQLRAEGVPADAVAQYAVFLEQEVVSDISGEDLLYDDPDTLENLYRDAGIDIHEGYFDCLRQLRPRIQGKTGKSFVIEMDERQFRAGMEDPAEEGYSIVEVEVMQPFINTADCTLTEETAIIYRVYDMVIR